MKFRGRHQGLLILTLSLLVVAIAPAIFASDLASPNDSLCEMNLKEPDNGMRSRLFRYVFTEGIASQDGRIEVSLWGDGPDTQHLFNQTQATTVHFFEQFSRGRLKSLEFYPVGYELAAEKEAPRQLTVGGSEGDWRFAGLTWKPGADGKMKLSVRIFSRQKRWLIKGSVFVSSSNADAETNDLLYKIRELEPIRFSITQHGPSYEPKFDLRYVPTGRKSTLDNSPVPASQSVNRQNRPQLPARLLKRSLIDDHIPTQSRVISLFSGLALSENMISRVLRRKITVVDQDLSGAQKWDSPFLQFAHSDFLTTAQNVVAPADTILLINPFLEGNTGIRFGDFAENLKRILDITRPYLKPGGKILIVTEFIDSRLESRSSLEEPKLVRRPHWQKVTLDHIAKHYPKVKFKKDDRIKDFLWPRDLHLTTPARRSEVTGWEITLD